MTIVKNEIKEVAKKADPLKKAIKLMAEYRELTLAQQAAGKRKKDLEYLLFQLAEHNRGEWFAEHNTKWLGDEGKLSYVNTTTLILDEGYEAKAFNNAFPECCKVVLEASTIRGLCVNADTRGKIELLGVKLGTRETFSVTAAK